MIRRLLLLGHPGETRFFVFVGGFGLVLAAAYWFLTRELAGTVLLAGFGLGAGLLGIRLVLGRPGRERQEPGPPDDTPFLDESGRLPGETLAPLAVGLGVALSLTAVVFGPWLLVAGALPLAWGGWAWLAGARDELDATVAAEDELDAMVTPGLPVAHDAGAVPGEPPAAGAGPAPRG